MTRFSTIFSLIIIFLSFSSAKSQETLSVSELESFLDKAELQAQNYTKVFQNLSAEELKTKFYYKSNGDLDEKRVIKSLFIVYQSPVTKNIEEFRNVLEYNGKNVLRDEKEIAEFFEKLGKTDTPQEEYEKLKKESLRFDGKRTGWGFTLSQPRPFMKDLRPNFEFRVVGKEKIRTREVWVIEYKQTKASPHILTNPTKEEENKSSWATQYNMIISDAFRPTNPRLVGKIWLDAETAQIWRNEFKVVLNPQKLQKPLETTEFIYEYQPSEFGILVPLKSVVKTIAVKGKDDKTLSIKPDYQGIHEYSNFKEFKSEAQDFQTGEN